MLMRYWAIMSFSRASPFRCKAAYFGLFAILLLTFGPVISQVQAVLLVNNAMASHVVSDHQSMVHHISAQHTEAKVVEKLPAANSLPSHHFMSLCGYCDLIHHSPLVIFYSPFLIDTFSARLVVYPQYFVDYCSPAYSKALSRAPPVKLAIAITS